MILELLLPLFIILYWFTEGVTEGYTWAKPKRRKENKLIRPIMAQMVSWIIMAGEYLKT